MESKPKPETPLIKKILPARGAAQRATAILKEQHTRRPRNSTGRGVENESHEESDDAEDEDEDENEESDPPGTRRKSSSKGTRRRGRGRGRGRGGAGGERARTPLRQQPSEKSPKSHTVPSLEYSSPLTSPETVTPQKRSRPSTSATPSKRTKLATSPRSVKPSNSFATATSFSPSTSSFYTAGDLAWVQLNSDGKVIDHPKDVKSVSYWWPAKVTKDKIAHVEVKLFGDDGHGVNRVVKTSSPAIMSFRQDNRARFSSTTFNLASPPSDDDPFEAPTGSGIEAQPSNLTSRWMAAFDLALADDADDELMDPLVLLNMTKSAKKRKGRSRAASSSSEPTFTPSPNRVQRSLPAPLDSEIKVGEEDGELVLARDHKDRPDHWPARVIGVSQHKRTGNWLYEIRFIDGKKRKIDRKWFFSSDQEGFGTCQLGVWRTELAASDIEGTDSEDDLRNSKTSRSLSPPPSESDLEDITDCREFCELPPREQMRYVYPVLCRIIRREYEPALDRHGAFMRGGKTREQLAQTASVRGEFSDNEMKRVSALLRRTMLRNERWAERVYDGDNVRHDEESPAALASDATKAESVAESVVAKSSDFDAALALAGLKSSQDCTLPAAPVSSPFAPSTSPTPVVSKTTNIIADSPEPPPSSLVSTNAVEYSSDMEIDSDGREQLQGIDPEHEDEIAPKVTAATTSEANFSQPVYTSPSVLLKREDTRRAPPNIEDSPPHEHAQATITARPRPTGCPEYENLSRSERGLYCADVLLPEAVLQLHLLRAGRRTSAHLLAPEEEAKLYEEGHELMQTEVSWVTQIVQLRQLAERTAERTRKKKESTRAIVQGGTFSRPKVMPSGLAL